MSRVEQTERLIELGVPELAGTSAAAFRRLADELSDPADGWVVVHPRLVPASRLAPLLRRTDLPGFVVEDLDDLDQFVPIPGLVVPDQPLYLITSVERGDDLRNRSPDDALPKIAAGDRSPLTIAEGICWLLHDPTRLAPNHCFMCIGSRKPKAASRLDARTPAIWISGGTGRDGQARRGAPKVGWCWAGNRHRWLGFASTAERLG